jgi:nucleoside phosphorylase
MTAEPFRAVILTALSVECEAVRKHLTDLREETHPCGTIYQQGKFTANNLDWNVAIAEIGAGNLGAAQEAERAINYFNPHVILFVGVAGGIKDVKLGDVVASTKIYGYESGKAEKTTFKTRPEVGLSAFALEQRAKVEARKEDWLKRLPSPPCHTPQVFVGPIAAGEKVVASNQSEVFQFLQLQYGDAIAVEMEGFGFLKAAHSNQQVSALVIRGISDLINNKTEADKEGYQKIAAGHASAFAFEVLAKFHPRNSDIDPEQKFKEEVEFLKNEYSQDFNKIFKSLKKGQLIIFLGSETNSSADDLEPEKSPPSDIRIAKHLVTKVPPGNKRLEELIGLPCEFCPVEATRRPESKDNLSNSNDTCPIINLIKTDQQRSQELKYEQELTTARLAQRCLGQILINTNGNDHQLFKEFRAILKPDYKDYEPNNVQLLLSNIAAKIDDNNAAIKENNGRLSQLIILTTNLDHGLEKAFEKKGLDIDVVYYSVTDRRFLYKPYRRTNPRNNEYTFNKNKPEILVNQLSLIDRKGAHPDEELFAQVERPIILKLYGGSLYKSSREHSSFVVTETHHISLISYLQNTSKKNNKLPIKLVQLLEKSDILLIGYNANDLHLKNILHSLFPKRWYEEFDLEKEGGFRGWLIDQSIPGELAHENYWKHWGIKLIECSWNVFIAALQEYDLTI